MEWKESSRKSDTHTTQNEKDKSGKKNVRKSMKVWKKESELQRHFLSVKTFLSSLII